MVQVEVEPRRKNIPPTHWICVTFTLKTTKLSPTKRLIVECGKMPSCSPEPCSNKENSAVAANTEKATADTPSSAHGNSTSPRQGCRTCVRESTRHKRKMMRTNSSFPTAWPCPENMAIDSTNNDHGRHEDFQISTKHEYHCNYTSEHHQNSICIEMDGSRTRIRGPVHAS